MGQDKALLPLQPGGVPLARHVIERLRPLTDDLLVVSDYRTGYGALGAPVKPDQFPGTGTLGGIATAIREARHDHVLVVACDLPFLSVPLITWMMEQPRDYDVLVPRQRGVSRQGTGLIYQTLHAIYSRHCLVAIEGQLRLDNRKVVGFYDNVTVRTVEESTMRKFDPELRSFFNANTPQALEEARRIRSDQTR
jgi:molybdopterin-guanine dinucleotide biosynthesis protein A